MIDNPQKAIIQIIGAFTEHVRKSKGSPFGDKKNDPNSIIDAEMLLILLMPYAAIRGKFDLGDPLHADDALALKLNQMVEVKNQGCDLSGKVNDKIVDLLMTFFNKYSQNEGTVPNFSIGSYGSDAEDHMLSTDKQPEIVDSYAMSLTLCIYVLRLIAAWKDSATKGKSEKVWQKLESLASKRLTASMQGLLSSFVVSTSYPADWNRLTNTDWDNNKEIESIRDRLCRLGVTELTSEVAFECGWSWGPVEKECNIIPRCNADEKKEWIDRTRPLSVPLWSADPAPYLYFTVTALDSIADLNSDDVMSGSLLNGDQLLLADRLRSFGEVTSRYWSTVAFTEREDSSWNIEEIPWRTADGVGSDYWTLYVLRMVGDNLPRGVGDTGVGRIIDLLEELAQRSRITRKPYPPSSDSSIEQIHAKGYRLNLEPAKDTDSQNTKNPIICYAIYDFAPQLLKQAAQLLKVSLTDNHRMRILRLINNLSAHLHQRSTTDEAALSWDYPEKIYKDYYDTNKEHKIQASDKMIRSWYFTERVMEALIARVEGEKTRPKTSEQLRSVAAAALTEAEWRARQEEGQSDDITSIEQKLTNARSHLEEDPLMALSIAVEIGENRLKRMLSKK